MTGEINPLQQLQLEYWTYNPSEHQSLVARGEDLSWNEWLRLHHLNCLELLQTDEGRKLFEAQDSNEARLPEMAGQLLQQTYARLASEASPYRAHACVVWRRQGSASVQREHDQMGLAMNASLTHVGAIEVVQPNGAEKPASIDFIGISEVRSVVLGPPAIFRPARISFDDARVSVLVHLPSLYGISWRSRHPYDRDGSLTRFGCHRTVGEFGAFGIGIGHQDFLLRSSKGAATVMGLGRIQEIQTPLDMRDPSFERRCRARGIDPDEVRRRHGVV
jgi:hypothetical protein